MHIVRNTLKPIQTHRQPLLPCVKPYSCVTSNRRTKVITNAINFYDFNEVSYYVGKSIILFTMFYCGLNWMHYRDLRKKNDRNDDKNI